MRYLGRGERGLRPQPTEQTERSPHSPPPPNHKISREKEFGGERRFLSTTRHREECRLERVSAHHTTHTAAGPHAHAHAHTQTRCRRLRGACRRRRSSFCWCWCRWPRCPDGKGSLSGIEISRPDILNQNIPFDSRLIVISLSPPPRVCTVPSRVETTCARVYIPYRAPSSLSPLRISNWSE